VEDLKYQSPGKPKKGAEKTLTGYKLQVDYQKNEEHIASEMKKAGKFIISTNELNTKHSEILPNYKGLQYAEMGNRFLKDPTFMLSSIFLKLPRRIDALMMVMTLTAFVYHFAEKRLRDALKEKNETVPNQVKKRIKNPTLRSIFIAFEGIDIRKTFSQKTKKLKKEVVTNINELKARIISYFGHYALVVYGLVPDS
jgi:transposase